MNWISKLSFQLTDQKAFSLVELAVTVSVVGIISSLAISQVQEYKRRANDLIALTSLYNARTGLADDANQLSVFTFFYNEDLTSQVYANGFDGIPGYVHSEGVKLQTSSTSPGVYFIESDHSKGSQKTTPQVGNRRGTVSRKTFVFETATSEITSTYPGFFGATNYICSGSVTPPP